MRGWPGCSDLAGIKDPITHSTEPKVTIMWSLIDTEVQADREVEFSCEVLRAGATDAQWHLQGLPLQRSKVTEAAVLGNCTHMLLLKGVTPEDVGTVFFHMGLHKFSAQLTVQGLG